MTDKGTKPSWGNSKTWVSEDAKVQQNYYTLEPKLTRAFPVHRPMAKRCPYIPRTLPQYVTHLRELKELVAKKQKRTIEQRLKERNVLQKAVSIKRTDDGQVFKWDPRGIIAFNGRVLGFGCFDDKDKGIMYPRDYDPVVCDPANRSAVLAQQTIWVVADRHRGSWREEADWPCMQEMKWEGSQRIASEDGKFGRYMAVPRVRALPGASWAVMPFNEQYPLDQVMRIPDVEDVYAPVDEIEEVDVPHLLDQDLIRAMDIPNDEI